ncbi:MULTISPECIES: hypothetical protein [unclassified Chryseobacterium]|uniref:hypothetical protein n=1 Tax=unclassified Chryseobacterium TaxID=2593645 RepID=UPI00100BB404|nr:MULTISPECIES: hypothetical protein [unclassified Chryseobacterium]RXM49749.1 hypothetical protein BOQ64_21995 [Chryseobacterium sp. CH25]RXM62982.1 hypothetical protein BOQ60_19210 [Chryseobacterium sp. CH1]
MKSIKILPFLFLLLLMSCNKLSTTPEDKKSVEEVQKFYGGSVGTMKGVDFFNGKSNNYFELTIKGSGLIDKQPERSISSAANIAYIAYQNQKPETYDIIKVKIFLSDGSNISKSFSKKELQEVKDIYPEVDKVNSFLMNKDYNGILEMFEPKFKPEDKLVKDGLFEMDSKLGSIQKIQFQGFEFIDDSNLGHTVLIREVSKRDNMFPFINIAFDRKTKKLLNIEFP